MVPCGLWTTTLIYIHIQIILTYNLKLQEVEEVFLELSQEMTPEFTIAIDESHPLKITRREGKRNKKQTDKQQ